MVGQCFGPSLSGALLLDRSAIVQEILQITLSDWQYDDAYEPWVSIAASGLHNLKMRPRGISF